MTQTNMKVVRALTEGYFFHKIGETKEEFTVSSDINNVHMFGPTRLELTDDQVGFVAEKLYSTNKIVIRGKLQSPTKDQIDSESVQEQSRDERETEDATI